jgi:predicted MPP superfamily phosphohydrolase
MKLSGLGFLSFLLASIGGFGYASFIEPGWLDIEKLKLKLPHLPPTFNGFRIAQISDIHIGGWMNQERLSQVVDAVISQAPDLVVMTGDFVIGHDWHGDVNINLAVLKNELSRLTKRVLTLSVLGNHDYWLDADIVRTALQSCGVIEIGNDVYTLERGSEEFHIAGIDDVYVRRDDLGSVLEKLPEHGGSMLLVHEPDFADRSAETGRFDLQVSGHSHGGQVILPAIGPPFLPKYAEKYPSGLYRVREMYQYTNRGVGMTNPTVRFNCRPEITVFKLESP